MSPDEMPPEVRELYESQFATPNSLTFVAVAQRETVEKKTPLSPAAQALYDAMWGAFSDACVKGLHVGDATNAMTTLLVSVAIAGQSDAQRKIMLQAIRAIFPALMAASELAGLVEMLTGKSIPELDAEEPDRSQKPN